MTCELCGKPVQTGLKINAPESTFNITDKTVSLNIAECGFCGLVQLVDIPLSPDYEESKKSIGMSSEYREIKMGKLREFVNKYNLTKKSIAEIGCGNGEYLDILIGVGVDGVVGYNNLSKAALSKSLKDCIFSFYYLEHMPDPINFVSAVYRLLNKNGLIYIEVPNYDYIIKKGAWLEFTRDHRFYFGKKTITHLLSICGFEIEYIDNYTDDSLVAVGRKISAGTLNRMRACMEADIVNISSIIGDMRFNVYGAGHHALLLLHLTGKKPERIFDSNPSKVGMKVGGIEVELGNNVAEIPNDEVILVCCGGYNKEIVEMLKGMGKTNIMEWK